ncbi:MAG: DUF2787 family protein [Bacteroidales bacterium]|nr:DUF2787 family protein [Bacteroidales bacterium]
MIIQQTGYPLAISKKLILILNNEIELHSEVDTSSGCIFNFRDPGYSAESGGYHPVEIYIDENGRFQNLTDFAYVGGDGHYAELVKELNFDFSYGLFQHMGRNYPIAQGKGLFEIWQSNFCAYYQNKVFTVTVEEL